MNDVQEIYVLLLGEAVEVWRPVKAIYIKDNIYKIIEQYYNREDEKWEFEPGEIVHCELTRTSDGKILIAKRIEHQSGAS